MEYVVSNVSILFYTYNYTIYDELDVVVYKVPKDTLPDDTLHKLILNVDYSVTINGDTGGVITLLYPPTLDDSIVIERTLEVDRDTDYASNGGIYADDLNIDQNYQTYLIADSLLANKRAIQMPVSVTGVNTSVEAPLPKAVIRWNDTGTQLINDADLGADLDDVKVQVAYSAQFASAPHGVLVDDGINPPSYSSYSYSIDSANSETQSELEAWKSEASRLTSDSYAVEPLNTFVKIHTSNGDGTFTATDTVEYSSLHWSKTLDKDLGQLGDVTITNPVANEAIVFNVSTNGWENGTVIGLPNETGHLGKTVSNEGVEGDSSWRFTVSNPTNVNADETLIANGMMVSPTIDDGFTITVPDGQTLVIL